jgi:hypothetical protein
VFVQVANAVGELTPGSVVTKNIEAVHVGSCQGLALQLEGAASDTRSTWKLLKACVEPLASGKRCDAQIARACEHAVTAG